MVLVHVGDHIDDGEQTEEGAVGLIGFGDEVVAAAQMGVGAVDIEPPPDDDRGVQTGRVEDGGRQGRGGGLAVRTGNGHALAQAHQLGQHLGTGDDGDIAAARFHHFGVVLGDGRGFDQHLHVAHVLGRMAHGDAGPKTAQMLDHGRIAHVRARDVIAQVEQDLGDAAHAGAADAHHVNLPNLAVHMSSLSLSGRRCCREPTVRTRSPAPRPPAPPRGRGHSRRPPRPWRAACPHPAAGPSPAP